MSHLQTQATGFFHSPTMTIETALFVFLLAVLKTPWKIAPFLLFGFPLLVSIQSLSAPPSTCVCPAHFCELPFLELLPPLLRADIFLNHSNCYLPHPPHVEFWSKLFHTPPFCPTSTSRRTIPGIAFLASFRARPTPHTIYLGLTSPSALHEVMDASHHSTFQSHRVLPHLPSSSFSHRFPTLSTDLKIKTDTFAADSASAHLSNTLSFFLLTFLCDALSIHRIELHPTAIFSGFISLSSHFVFPLCSFPRSIPFFFDCGRFALPHF